MPIILLDISRLYTYISNVAGGVGNTHTTKGEHHIMASNSDIFIASFETANLCLTHMKDNDVITDDDIYTELDEELASIICSALQNLK